MALDNFIELLESEFVDGLMGSLQPIACSVIGMEEIYQSEAAWIIKDQDAYDVFHEEYNQLLNEPHYRELKVKIDGVDKERDKHSPNFEALKLYIHQIDTAIDSIGQFFGQDDNNSENFRERFKPFSGYLEVIKDALDGIKCLNSIYANMVDTDAITQRLMDEGNYHQRPKLD